VGFAVSCGSDGESPEDAFCDSGDSLQANIEGIAAIDIVAEGTDAVSEQFAAIESDVQDLVDSGSDVADDELSALESAVDELGSVLDTLGGDLSVEAAQGAVDSVTNVVTAADDVVERLSTTCP